LTSARIFTKIPPVLTFAKYHGLGNDFIVVDALDGAPALSPAQARTLCDRHLGIGADQLLTLRPQPGADARMQVHNADGSEVGQCGNGLRCVARFLYDEGLVPESRETVIIAAGEETYPVRRLAPDRYRASIGMPDLRHVELPADVGPNGQAVLEAGGRRFEATCVHVGNPPAVIFGDESPRRLAEAFGPALERHPSFVARVNVSFVRPMTGGFETVVFERGDGITLACGSGACAIGVAAVQRGLWPAGKPMSVRLPGGILTITIAPSGEVEMEGAAVRVFTGEIRRP
jgi:diaminopimelate epimerase